MFKMCFVLRNTPNVILIRILRFIFKINVPKIACQNNKMYII